MEKIQKEIAEMIENPSWQECKDTIPILSSDGFNSFLQRYLKNKDLSALACNQMKKQLVNSGFLLDFGTLVIMKPQWLADTFRAIISIKNQADKTGKDGILSTEQIVKRLGFGKEECLKLIEIWEKNLNVCIRHPNLPNKYIIPSLLDEEKHAESEMKWNETKSMNNCIGRTYILPFLPAGIFEGIFVKTFKISHVIQFWRNGLVLRTENDSFLQLEISFDKKPRINSSEYKISIQATGLISFDSN